jgi:hypothetical protein
VGGIDTELVAIVAIVVKISAEMMVKAVVVAVVVE